MEELDLKEIGKIFWEKRLNIILIICIFIVAGLAYAIFGQTPKYTSVTTLLLTSSGTLENLESATTITTTDLTINSKLVKTYGELIKSKRVIGKVLENLKLDIEEGIVKKSLLVTAKQDTNIIEISVTLPEPNISEQIANETARVFIDAVKEYYGMENLKVVDFATIPSQPSNINETKTVMAFVFVGVIVSCVYIFLINVLDNTVKFQEDIEEKYKIPVLATIPIYDINSEKDGKKK